MININEVKEYTEFLAKKWQSGGIFTPDQFNLVIPNVVRNIVRWYYGAPEQYQPGMPMPAVGADMTQLVRDYLSKLKDTQSITINDMGIGALPSDYIHKSAAVFLDGVTTKVNKTVTSSNEDCEDCDDNGSTVQKSKSANRTNETTVYRRPVTFLSDEQFDWRDDSYIRKAERKYPFARMIADGIEVRPKDLKSIELIYYRYPVTPKWGYTTAVAGFAVYDPTTSVDIELPEICAEEVVFACLQRMGISIREPALISWADRQRITGK